MLFANVHTSENQLLYVQDALLQKKFGVAARRGQGRCLIAQVAFSISAIVPKVRYSRIVTHVDQRIARDIDMNGHTMSEIIETFEDPVKTDRGLVKLDIEVKKYGTYDAVLFDIMQGQPVMFMFDADVCSVLINEGTSYGDGEVRATVIRHGRTGRYHSLLAIGFDLQGYLIMRDSRSSYAFNGYIKISAQIIQDGWRFLDAFAVQVNSAERV